MEPKQMANALSTIRKPVETPEQAARRKLGPYLPSKKR